jgi:ribosomal protein S19E (S16A)
MLNTDLSPVEIMFLQSPAKMKITDIFSTILKNLVLNKVLYLTRIYNYPTERSRRKQKYFMFEKGINYTGYEPKPFEKSFLSPFEEYNQLQTKTLTNYVLRNYSMPGGFIDRRIFQPLHKEGYISSIPVIKTFGFYNLSSKGKEIVKNANEFIAKQEQKLSSFDKELNEEFVDILNETGTFAFKFKKINPNLYDKIVSNIKRIYINQPFGTNKDLINFMQAINVDLSYFNE